MLKYLILKYICQCIFVRYRKKKPDCKNQVFYYQEFIVLKKSSLSLL